MATLNVRVDAELEELLTEEAASLGLRRSDIVRLALRQWLDLRQASAGPGQRFLALSSQGLGPLAVSFPERSEHPVGHERYQRVAHLLGSLDSGVDDLGTDHEKHLREMFAQDDDSAAGHGADRGDAGRARPEP